ncbi:hypothetical protein ACFWBL_29200, partial [Streptomyces nojiriensis]
MSDTQGSHRRGGPVPEAYEAQPLAQPVAWPSGTGDPGPTAWDPEPLAQAPGQAPAPAPAPVPAPRGGRRRRAGLSPAELSEADTLAAAPVAPGSGRRRAAAPVGLAAPAA